MLCGQKRGRYLKYLHMIQRIQTIFLILAIAALTAFLFLPVITVDYTGFSNTYKGFELSQRFPFFGVVYIYYINAILTVSSIVFTFISILFFSKRTVQMALCWFAILLAVFAEGFVFYNYQNWTCAYDPITRKLFECYVNLTWYNLLVVAGVLFQVLAIIFIRKYEETVRSLDRLR